MKEIRHWSRMSDEQIINYGKEHRLYGLSPKEAEKKDAGYYDIVIRRGLVNKTFVSKRRNWSKMSDKELIKYAKQHDLYGLSPKEVYKREGGYYDTVRKRGLDNLVFKRRVRNWSKTTDEELIEYAKHHGLYGLSPSEARKKDGGYCNIALKRGIINKIFVKERRKWSEMTDEEVIEYGKKHGLYGLSLGEADKKDGSYYQVVRKRGLSDKVFVDELRKWSKMSDEELIDYAKQHGLYGLSPSEADKKDGRYYRAVWTRGLVDKIFEKLRKGEVRKWSKMSDKEIIEYGKQRGLYGLSPSETIKMDQGYYFAITKRDLGDKVFFGKPRYLSKVSDEELIDYAKQHGLYGLSPSEADKKDGGYYEIVRKRGLVDRVFKRITKMRNWSKMSNEEIIEYGKKYKLFGLNPKKAVKEDPGYYGVVIRRGLKDKVFKKIMKKEGRNWKRMSDEEIIEYGKKNGLYGLGPLEANRKDGGYYNAVRSRNLINKIFKVKGVEMRKWRKMTDEEIIEYGKQHDLYGLRPYEATKKDPGYYHIVRGRGLANRVFKSTKIRKKAREWSKMSNEELIEYGKQNGLYGLSLVEADKKDPGYYLAITKRGLAYKIFIKKIIGTKDIVNSLNQDPHSRAIASLGINGYTSEAAKILCEIWPERFPPYERLVKELPRIIPSIRTAIHPVEFNLGMVEELYEEIDMPIEAKRDLGSLLIRIGIERHQPEFNRNPIGTVNSLYGMIEKMNNQDVKHVFEEILGFYNKAFEFEIPGYGRLRDKI